MPALPVASVPSARPERVASGGLQVASVVLFTFLISYFRSFVFPDIPLWIMGDQLGFFHDGSRILEGQLPYRDYFQIVPPGTDLTYALLIKCFGLRAWIPNLVMAFLAAATALLITLIARRLMQGVSSLLPALLFTAFVLYGSLDPTHHWFSTVAVMGATLVLLDGTSRIRVAAAGALCGLAACFTQTKGAVAVAAFVIYFVWKMRQDRAATKEWRWKCLLLCVVAAAVFFATNAYFIAAAGVRQWIYCTIIYPLRYYPAPTVNNWRVVLYDFGWHGGALKWICYPFIYSVTPLVYIVFLFKMRRLREAEPSAPWDKLFLLTLTGLGIFLAVASAPSMKRLSTISAPSMILLVWLLHRWLSQSRTIGVYARARLRLAITITAVAFAIEPAIHAQFHRNSYLNLPAGRVAFRERVDYEEFSWVLAHTHPGQYFFGMPPFYTPFHLRNPAPTETVETTEYTRPKQVAGLIAAIDSHSVPLMILRDSREFLRPAHSGADHAGPFRDYVLKNYRLVLSFPNGDDVWQKN